MIVQAAAQEDVDVVGLSMLSGAHLELLLQIMEGLKKKGMDDVIVVVGGIIPEEDIPRLKALGIAEVFGPGTPTPEIVQFITEAVRGKREG